MCRLVLFALLFAVCAAADEVKKRTKSLSRGWGGNITWAKDYAEGLSKMATSKKPLMVIHHREDCQFSEALKKAFVAEKSIQKMARVNFIMLNLVEETHDQNLAPDGYYVPRILFVDPSMVVRQNLVGKYSNRLYTYEPTDMDLLAQNMKQAKVLLHSEL